MEGLNPLEKVHHTHYENMPIQIYRTFHLEKNWKFSDKKLKIFLIFLLKT